MKKIYLIFCAILVLFPLLMSVSINPTEAKSKNGPPPVPGEFVMKYAEEHGFKKQAEQKNGPPPIPGELFPIPSRGQPITNNQSPTETVPILPLSSNFSITQTYSITQTKSGLVASDSLTNETLTKEQLLANPRYWEYGGSAVAQNAPYNLFKDSQGIHIGVQAVSNGAWAGFYAVTPNTNAALFHSVITTAVQTIPSNFYENGLYIQTSNGKINYVTCVSVTSSDGTVWAVVSATGNTNQATRFDVLWTDTSPNQPLTRDCTIITNGSNYLKVYLDNTLVYANDKLRLRMPAPFNAFLEPQNSHATMLYGIYKDFYVVLDENIKVINAPSTAARVDVVSSSGNVLASAPVSNGTAILDVGKYHFPLAANIKVYDINNIEIASTSSPASMFGGDVYSIS